MRMPTNGWSAREGSGCYIVTHESMPEGWSLEVSGWIIEKRLMHALLHGSFRRLDAKTVAIEEAWKGLCKMWQQHPRGWIRLHGVISTDFVHGWARYPQSRY